MTVIPPPVCYILWDSCPHALLATEADVPLCLKCLFPYCSLHDTQVYAVTEFPTVSGMEFGLSPPSDPVQFNSSGMNTHRGPNNTVQFIITYVHTYSKCTMEITIFCPLLMRMEFSVIVMELCLVCREPLIYGAPSI